MGAGGNSKSHGARGSYGYGGFPPYVPVAARRAKAAKEAARLAKKGTVLSPVRIEGRIIARTFWGKAFCDHLALFASMSNRLERGRTYVRNGSVIHLAIERCAIRAMVSGSELYEVNITLKPAPKARWAAIVRACAGHIGSLVELLSGRFDAATMKLLTAPDAGLLPREGELAYACSCPDASGGWVCKHVAAAMFGVGARLDESPELLFTLRDVDPSALLDAAVSAEVRGGKRRRGAKAEPTLADSELSEVFGIDIAGAATPPRAPKRASTTTARPAAPRPRNAKASKKQPNTQPRPRAKPPAGKRAAR